MEPIKGEYPVKKCEHWHHLLDSTIWNEFQFRDDDIIINAYSKSGTTWVQQIVAQLLWRGGDIYVSEESPWLDCRFPSKDERLGIAEAQKHRRFLKSHLPVDTLVFSPKAKYIYIGRDDTLRLAYQEIRAVLLNEPAVQDFRTAAFVVALRKIGTTHMEMGV